jgi:hypothetical protein
MFVISLGYMIDFEDDPAEKKKWEEMRESAKRNIREYLWDESKSKFIPHIYLNGSPFPENFNENAIHFHGGTAIAVEAGILSREEILTVYMQMLENVRLSGAPTIGLTLYPPYPDGLLKGQVLVNHIYIRTVVTGPGLEAVWCSSLWQMVMRKRLTKQ